MLNTTVEKVENKIQLIKITKNYQITLPARLRKGFSLREGDYLEAQMKDGVFMFKPKKLVDIDPSQEWFWGKKWQSGEKRASDDISCGKVKSFDGMDDFVKELEALK